MKPIMDFHRHMVLSAACAAFVVTVAGCKGPARSFCEERARIDCAYQYRCCEDDERVERAGQLSFVGLLGYTNSEGECVERSISFCSLQSGTDESIAAARQEWDAGAADGCLEDLKAAVESCDIEDYFAARDACVRARAATPLVENGDLCALSAECLSGACTLDLDEGGITKDVNEEGFAEGECLDLPLEGDACPDGICGAALFCNNDAECEGLRADRAGCDFDAQCGSQLCANGVCDTADVELEDKFCTGRD